MKQSNEVDLAKQSNEVDLGREKVGRLLFRLALPAITAQIINVLYNMVDRMYIGHIEGVGADALTGVGVTMPVIMSISAFAALVSMGGSARASIMMGRQKKDEAEKILGNCTSTLVAIAIVLTAVFLVWGKDILLAFGASEKTIEYAWSYMMIYVMGTLFVQLSLGLNAFINAQGYAKMGMLTVLIGAALNILLDPIFIFGFGLGVRGAALATIFSQGVSAIWVCYFLTSKRSLLRIRKENLKVKIEVIFPCIALGAAPFVMQFTESILSVCFNTSLFKYGGDTAVGVMTILSSVMQFSMLPLQGLSQGAQPITSYNYGAKNIDRVSKTFRLLLFSCVIYSGVMWALAMLIPQGFIAIFANDDSLKEMGIWAMRTYMAVSIVFGAQIACQQTFIAIGNAKTSLFLALLRKVILLIPLIYILPNLTFLKHNQVWAVFLAEPVADLIAVSVTVTMFLISFHKLKETNKTIEKRANPTDVI